MSDYRPTRMCPHRLCRPTHTALGTLGLVFVAQILFTGIVGVVYTAALGVIALAVGRLVHNKSLHDQVLEDEADQAATTHLVVRRNWALAAIFFDAFFLAAAAAVVSSLFVTRNVATPGGGTSAYVAIGLGITVTAASEYAHRQATRTAKPKRVTRLATAGSAG